MEIKTKEQVLLALAEGIHLWAKPTKVYLQVSKGFENIFKKSGSL